MDFTIGSELRGQKLAPATKWTRRKITKKIRFLHFLSVPEKKVLKCFFLVSYKEDQGVCMSLYRLRERLRDDDRDRFERLRDRRPLRDRERLRDAERDRERLWERPTSRSPSSLMDNLICFPLMLVPWRVSIALYKSSRDE